MKGVLLGGKSADAGANWNHSGAKWFLMASAVPDRLSDAAAAIQLGLVHPQLANCRPRRLCYTSGYPLSPVALPALHMPTSDAQKLTFVSLLQLAHVRHREVKSDVSHSIDQDYLWHGPKNMQ